MELLSFLELNLLELRPESGVTDCVHVYLCVYKQIFLKHFGHYY